MPSLYCQLCSREFKYEANLHKHIFKAHNQRITKTTLNLQTLPKSGKATDSLSEIPDRNELSSLKCTHENCGRILSTKYYLMQHLKTHTDEKTHECSYCSKAFLKFACLVRHMRIHTTEKPHSCPIPGCSLWFSRKDVVQRHIWTKHRHLIKLSTTGNRKMELNGNPMGMIRKSYSYYSEHSDGICRASLRMLCICPYCGKRFDKGGLENHIRTHTNEKPFKCDNCSFESNGAGSLRQHILRIHSEIKESELTCPICYGKTSSKKFKLQAHLNYHMATVHQKRKLSEFTKCSICRKKIITNTSMSHVFRLINHYGRMHSINLVAQVLLVRNSPSDDYYN